MSKIIWMSDPHFGHSNIIKYSRRDEFLNETDRKALDEIGDWMYEDSIGTWHQISDESVKNMDDSFIDQINTMADVNDTVVCAGDWSLWARTKKPKDMVIYYDRVKSYRDRIRCRNVFIAQGNHDKWDIFDDKYGFNLLFQKCRQRLKIKLPRYGLTAIVNHYCEINHEGSHHDNTIMLYGHSHSEIEDMMNDKFPHRRSMDIGFDNAKLQLGVRRPFTTEELLERLVR